MTVKTITLSNKWGNWRFEDLTLTLDSRLTVFTGRNGCGKTSILQALMDSHFLPSRVFTNKVCPQLFDVRDVIEFNTINEVLSGESLNVIRPFTAYSKGEQAIIRLYCSIANILEFVPTDDRLLVLIDDLGHELDPIWQHKILPSLVEDFPTAQFVITTTSPLILTQVQSDSLFFVEKRDKTSEITVSRQNEVNPGGNEINHNYTLGK